MQNNQFFATIRTLSIWLLAVHLALAACGGGNGAEDQAAQAAPPAGTPAQTASATLAWTASSNASIAGYRVYYGVASGAYLQPKGSGIAAGRADAFVVTGLAADTRHYFAVTAFDAQGNESDYSAEASKIVQ